MTLTSQLKELLKKLTKLLGSSSPDNCSYEQLLEDIDTFVFKLTSSFRPIPPTTTGATTTTLSRLGGNTTSGTALAKSKNHLATTHHNSHTGSVEYWEPVLVDQFNQELLDLLPSSLSTTHKWFEVLLKLAPLIGPKRFFSSWWSQLVLSCLNKAMSPTQEELFTQLVTEYLQLDQPCLGNDKGGKESAHVPGIDIVLIHLCTLIKQPKDIASTSGKLDTKALSGNPDVTNIGIRVHDNPSSFPPTQLHKILLEYGTRDPKGFFSACARVYPNDRLIINQLLIYFITERTDHTYAAAEGAITDKLLYSLLFGMEVDLLNLELTLLTMILPYLGSRLPQLLSAILAILGRFLLAIHCPLISLSQGSQKADSTPHELNLHDSSGLLQPTTLFTLVYGMYPANLLRFLKTPYLYLSAAQTQPSYFLPPLDLSSFKDPSLIQRASKPYLAQHLLSPDGILRDPEDELNDQSRLLSLEPTELVTQCLANYFQQESKEHAESNLRDGDPPRMFKLVSDYRDRLVTPLHPNPWEDREHLVCSHQLPPTFYSVEQLWSEQHLERFLRYHQTFYIRKLHREKITESSSEAERHSLYATCRALQQEVKLLKEVQDRQKLETGASQLKHIKWENELNRKLKHYRELTRDLRARNEQLEQKLTSVENKLVEQEKELARSQMDLASRTAYDDRLNMITRQLDEQLSKNQELIDVIIRWDMGNIKLDNLSAQVPTATNLPTEAESQINIPQPASRSPEPASISPADPPPVTSAQTDNDTTSVSAYTHAST